MKRIEPLGDAAFIVRDLGPEPAWRLAERLSASGLDGLLEAVASYQTVGVYVEPGAFDVAALQAWLDGPAPPAAVHEPRLHVISVCYSMGEDMAEVTQTLGLTVAQVVGAHTSTTYSCAAVGFQPGFAYLGKLPPQLCGIPRRAQPRVRIPAGAVGITGDQTGVYPSESPGGWALIGRTPFTIVDMASGYFPIVAGDCVRFEAIDEATFDSLLGNRL